MSSKRIYALQRQGNLLWLRVAVGSSSSNPLLLRLLVDTGSSYTVLPTKILERLGCNLEFALKTTTIVAAGGAIKVPIVAVPWFSCLGVEKSDFPVVAFNLPEGTLVNGLLDMDFLCYTGAIIDIVKAKISVMEDV
ncbi:MAG: hypothetical protein N5P05_003313 [Chroococcopsis gigantea SAG 12.99]|jgi:predicted aspartyl protease|nr:clan AA aspartic protease [Chlorogloea purpurea SAG 13.99]MDV3001707.1 hypothetical protein [Chroococcopsis gigantea SAG 12.99]